MCTAVVVVVVVLVINVVVASLSVNSVLSATMYRCACSMYSVHIQNKFGIWMVQCNNVTHRHMGYAWRFTARIVSKPNNRFIFIRWSTTIRGRLCNIHTAHRYTDQKTLFRSFCSRAVVDIHVRMFVCLSLSLALYLWIWEETKIERWHSTRN